MQQYVASNNPPAVKIGYLPFSGKIHVQVITAGVVLRLGHSREDLDTPAPVGTPAGLQFNSNQNLVELDWIGEVWAVGLSTNASAVTYMFQQISGR